VLLICSKQQMCYCYFQMTIASVSTRSDFEPFLTFYVVCEIKDGD
jgi:hypothetical protein